MEAIVDLTDSQEGQQEALGFARLWWLILLLGLAAVAAGAILVARPSKSLATLAVVAGIFLTIDGIVALIGSLRRDAENRALAAIVGVLGIVIGIILIRHPTNSVSAIGLLIGIWLVAAGVVRGLVAIVRGRHFVIGLVLAVLEVAVGVAIVSQPHIGYTTLAILLGIWLIVSGLGTMAVGIGVRRAIPELEHRGT